jgi:hypothetical protein
MGCPVEQILRWAAQLSQAARSSRRAARGRARPQFHGQGETSKQGAVCRSSTSPLVASRTVSPASFFGAPLALMQADPGATAVLGDEQVTVEPIKFWAAGPPTRVHAYE